LHLAAPGAAKRPSWWRPHREQAVMVTVPIGHCSGLGWQVAVLVPWPAPPPGVQHVRFGASQNLPVAPQGTAPSAIGSMGTVLGAPVPRARPAVPALAVPGVAGPAGVTCSVDAPGWFASVMVVGREAGALPVPEELGSAASGNVAVVSVVPPQPATTLAQIQPPRRNGAAVLATSDNNISPRRFPVDLMAGKSRGSRERVTEFRTTQSRWRAQARPWCSIRPSTSGSRLALRRPRRGRPDRQKECSERLPASGGSPVRSSLQPSASRFAT